MPGKPDQRLQHQPSQIARPPSRSLVRLADRVDLADLMVLLTAT
jgi:hypothetical protein